MKRAVHSQGLRIAWVWAIPVAALGIVIWLGVRSLMQGGPEVVVTFVNAGGVKAGDTKVTYNNMQVGQVEAVKLHKNLQAVDVTVTLDADMEGHVGPGTRFWISGQQIELSNPSSIKSIIAGPTIEMDPHDGKTQHHSQGLNQEPVLKQEPPGTRFALHATTLGSISRGAPIYYRSLKVGEVSGYTFADPDKFTIYSFVKAPYTGLVHDNTRFWNASAARLSMGSGGPSFSLLSPAALISGAIAFETPSQHAGKPASKDTTFTLYDGKTSAEYAPGPDAVSYHVVLTDGQAVALDKGAPVMLEGRRVGSVTDVNTALDDGKLQTTVTVAVEPHQLPVANVPGTTPRQRMDSILALLVGQGLRAELGSTTPVVGAKDIDLRFVPGVQEAALIAGSPPGIPTAPGGGIGQIMRQVSDVASKLDNLPLPAIADEIHQATQKLAALSQSPQTRETLEHLDQSVSNIDAATREVRGQIGPLLAQVRKASQQADAALASARQLVGGGGGGGPEQAGLPHALYELTQAARSLRELANLLDRDPNALVFGRKSR